MVNIERAHNMADQPQPDGDFKGANYPVDEEDPGE